MAGKVQPVTDPAEVDPIIIKIEAGKDLETLNIVFKFV